MFDQILVKSVTDRSVSETKHVKHVFRLVAGFRKNGTRTEPVEINREVILLSGGGLVLPYFKNGRDKWKVVLISQYRPAIDKTIIEAAGGILGSEPVDIALSRELLEETGIKVKPQSIRIMVNEYVHPSILSSCSIGGIVEIDRHIVKNKRKAGLEYENEWTQVEVLDLTELIKKREANLIMIDLMTSRLIDEVAKATGLLVKKY